MRRAEPGRRLLSGRKPRQESGSAIRSQTGTPVALSDMPAPLDLRCDARAFTSTHQERHLNTVTDNPTTISTYLRPIDRDGLMAFAEKGRNNPGSRGKNNVHTVMQGQYRSFSYVGNHTPVVVDEPLHLFGEDTAPAPGEIVLSGLGGCLAVGITAVATWKQIKLSKLEVFLEADIGNPGAWGAGGAEMESAQMGFQAIRVKIVIEGDATRKELDEIVRHANYFSPVANSMRNPIPMTVALAD
jgi:uncharacterized OsmC-like protein